MKSIWAYCLVLGVATLLAVTGCVVTTAPPPPQPCAEGFYWSPGYGCVPIPVNAAYAIVNINGLSLRTCPSTKCSILNSLYVGEQVQILGVEGGWTHVWAYGRGQVGWVATKYLN